MNRFAIIGDIHANIYSLEAVLKSVDNYRENNLINKVIFLGDLLTYGVEVNETLSKIKDYTKKNSSTLILGNHDLLYFEIYRKSLSCFDKMPDWIKESVNKNYHLIDFDVFNSLKFESFYKYKSILFSHANPYILNSKNHYNWSYLNTYKEHISALSNLRINSFSLGVFGHTHRRKIFIANQDLSKGNFETIKLNHQYNISSLSQLAIVNAGSIGQPRSKEDLTTSWLLIEEDSTLNNIKIEYRSYKYDYIQHLHSIDNSDHCLETKTKIKSFFL